jgi:hypothetical protein
VIVNAICASSSCHFYYECKNKQGSCRNKFCVNQISGCRIMNNNNSFVLRAKTIFKNFIFLFFLRLGNYLHRKTWFIQLWYVRWQNVENLILRIVWASLYENYIWSSFLNPIFTILNYWKSELGLDWLLQHFHHCDWHNSLLCHICYQFNFFFHHITHSS